MNVFCRGFVRRADSPPWGRWRPAGRNDVERPHPQPPRLYYMGNKNRDSTEHKKPSFIFTLSCSLTARNHITIIIIHQISSFSFVSIRTINQIVHYYSILILISPSVKKAFGFDPAVNSTTAPKAIL